MGPQSLWNRRPQWIPWRIWHRYPGLRSWPRLRSGLGPDKVCGDKAKDKEWVSITKLGLLVKEMKINSLEEIYVFSLTIKESEINDFLGGIS